MSQPRDRRGCGQGHYLCRAGTRRRGWFPIGTTPLSTPLRLELELELELSDESATGSSGLRTGSLSSPGKDALPGLVPSHAGASAGAVALGSTGTALVSSGNGLDSDG